MTLSRRTFLQGAAACGAAATLGLGKSIAAEPKKAVVVFYSRSGNTEALARMIGARTGLQVLRIDVKEPYAAEYSDMTYVARDEVQRKARRELKTPLPDLTSFDTVFLGSPDWWGSLSVPMATFLMDENLAGKTVYPFITSGSSSPQGALDRIRELCPQAKIGAHFYVPGAEAADADNDVAAWLKKIGF